MSATPTGSGPVWGVATEDLNATILEWPAGARTPRHVNQERDIVLVVLAGRVDVETDGVVRPAEAGEVVVIEKGSSRRLVAGPEGVRYLTVHRVRSGLSIEPSAPTGE